MTALPVISDFNAATVTEAQYKTAMSGLRDYLSGLLGSDGLAATALATLGSLLASTVAKTAAYTVVVGDRGRLISATNTWNLTLPPAATAGAGFAFALRNNGTGTITVVPDGAELINGQASQACLAGQSGMLISTGTGWITTGMIGSAVMASCYDTTAGRVAVTRADGIFGWGATGDLTILADLDAATIAAGVYRFDGATAGTRPATASGVSLGTMLQINNRSNRTVQLLCYASADDPLWMRQCITGVYGAWAPVGARQADGTAAAPGVSFYADTNTGIYRAAADTLAFATAGSEALRITAANLIQSVGGQLSLAGNIMGGVAVTVADDAVAVITPPRKGGFATITCAGQSATPLPEFSGQIWFDTGTTLQIVKGSGFTGVSANFNVVITDVAGTTGTDGYVTISVQTDVIKIENRSGSSRTFQVTFT